MKMKTIKQRRRLILAVMVVLCILVLAGCDSSDYKKAVSLYENANYTEAIKAFEALGDYKDSPDMVLASKYGLGGQLLENKEFDEAIRIFTELEDYEDSADLIAESMYQNAVGLFGEKKYAEALALFSALGTYKDSEQYRGEAAWAALHDYIVENGENKGSIYVLKSTEDKRVTYLSTVENNPEQLILYSALGSNWGFFNSLSDCSITITRGSSEAKYRLSSSSSTTANGRTGENSATADGTVDISTATDYLCPLDKSSNFSYRGVDIYGTVTTRSVPKELELSDAQACYLTMVQAIPAILEETGLGITMKDLGFKAIG